MLAKLCCPCASQSASSKRWETARSNLAIGSGPTRLMSDQVVSSRDFAFWLDHYLREIVYESSPAHRPQRRLGQHERLLAADGEGDAPLAVRAGAVDGDDPAEAVLGVADGDAGAAGGQGV